MLSGLPVCSQHTTVTILSAPLIPFQGRSLQQRKMVSSFQNAKLFFICSLSRVFSMAVSEKIRVVRKKQTNKKRVKQHCCRRLVQICMSHTQTHNSVSVKNNLITTGQLSAFSTSVRSGPWRNHAVQSGSQKHHYGLNLQPYYLSHLFFCYPLLLRGRNLKAGLINATSPDCLCDCE